MNYLFPLIHNIKDVLPHLAGRKEFAVTEKGSYTVINYHVQMQDTFPPVETEADAILRECRGIIFDTKSGNVMSRRYHKFFNAGEREEVSLSFIDLNRSHVILEKLDGSMVTPLVVDGVVRWGTKMGVTDFSAQIEEYVAKYKEYSEFANICLTLNVTPIFEWCSRQQKIVLEYAEDRLVLTAMRHNISGNYIHYLRMVSIAEGHGIRDVVRPIYTYEAKHDVRNIHSLVDHVRGLKGTEGYVVRFDDGHMVKVKCEWYLQLHKAKDLIRFEKDVLRLILEDKVDDLLPLLQPHEQDAVREYQKQVWAGIYKTAIKIQACYIEIQHNMKSKEKREFAVHHVKAVENKFWHSFLFGLWEGKNAGDMLIDALKQSCHSINRVENNRWMMNGVTMPEISQPLTTE